MVGCESMRKFCRAVGILKFALPVRQAVFSFLCLQDSSSLARNTTMMLSLFIYLFIYFTNHIMQEMQR